MRKPRGIPADRKAELLDHAIILSRSVGYKQVTRQMLADASGVSVALITHYFGTMCNLRRSVMSAAIMRSDLNIIAQGLCAGDAKAKSAKAEIKRAALERLL